MRKQPQHDKTLNDHIKELWTIWNNGTDLYFNQDHSFTSLLIGYFAYYYKGDNTHVEDAINYFLQKIDEWETEDDRPEEAEEVDPRQSGQANIDYGWEV